MAGKNPGKPLQDQAGKQGTLPPVAGRWKQGQSGNPGGRPKGKSLLAEIRDALNDTELLGKKNPGGKTNRRLLAEAAIRHALAGRSAYFRILCEYLFGKPVIRVEQKTIEGGASQQLTDEQADKLMQWIDENLKGEQE